MIHNAWSIGTKYAKFVELWFIGKDSILLSHSFCSSPHVSRHHWLRLIVSDSVCVCVCVLVFSVALNLKDPTRFVSIKSYLYRCTFPIIVYVDNTYIVLVISVRRVISHDSFDCLCARWIVSCQFRKEFRFGIVCDMNTENYTTPSLRLPPPKLFLFRSLISLLRGIN